MSNQEDFWVEGASLWAQETMDYGSVRLELWIRLCSYTPATLALEWTTKSVFVPTTA